MNFELIGLPLNQNFVYPEFYPYYLGNWINRQYLLNNVLQKEEDHYPVKIEDIVMEYNNQNQKHQNIQKQSPPKQIQQSLSQKYTKQSKVVYGKKNNETNLVNQIISFLSTKKKSIKALDDIFLQSDLKINLYYSCVKRLKTTLRKYVNTTTLLNFLFLELQTTQYADIKDYLRKSNLLSIEQLKSTMLRLSIHYLRIKCRGEIFSSSKMNRQSFLDHLEKKDKILSILLQRAKAINDKE